MEKPTIKSVCFRNGINSTDSPLHFVRESHVEALFQYSTTPWAGSWEMGLREAPVARLGDCTVVPRLGPTFVNSLGKYDKSQKVIINSNNHCKSATFTVC